jgi:hypothetical protein
MTLNTRLTPVLICCWGRLMRGRIAATLDAATGIDWDGEGKKRRRARCQFGPCILRGAGGAVAAGAGHARELIYSAK